MPNMGTLAVGHTDNLLRWFLSGKYRLTWTPVVGKAPHDRARNECHRLFLESECEYMLFLDADTVPPPSVIDHFLEADKDMISATVQTIQRHEDEPRLIPVAFRWNDEDPDDIGLKPYYGEGRVEKVDATTCACTLIKRRVMEAVGPRAFQFTYTDKFGTKGMGEDIFFCSLVSERGFEMFNHYGILCEHNHEVGMKCVNDLMVIASLDRQEAKTNG